MKKLSLDEVCNLAGEIQDWMICGISKPKGINRYGYTRKMGNFGIKVYRDFSKGVVIYIWNMRTGKDVSKYKSKNKRVQGVFNYAESKYHAATPLDKEALDSLLIEMGYALGKSKCKIEM